MKLAQVLLTHVGIDSRQSLTVVTATLIIVKHV